MALTAATAVVFVPAAIADPPVVAASPDATAAVTGHQRFLQQVRANMPVLHEDISDGFPLQRLDMIFGYRAQDARTQPRVICLRYPNKNGNDIPCPAGDTAHIGEISFNSPVNHLDYPAPFDTTAQRRLAASVPQRPTMYFFGKRDGAQNKSYAYWFFDSYNYFIATFNLGPLGKLQGETDRHEGDFEHVIVYANAANQPVRYKFFEHDSSRVYAATDPHLQTDGRIDGLPAVDNKHVRVYAAHGSHASETACGLWTYGVGLAGQRDRACSPDPYSDTIGTPQSATVAFTQANTALSNLDVKNWACFPGRLGASDPDLGIIGGVGGDAPKAPLVQSNDCPNQFERRAPHTSTTASTVGAVPQPDPAPNGTDVSDFVATTDAFAGVDRCGDYQKPSLSAGFILVVCNQDDLTRALASATPAPAPDGIAIAGSPSASPTATDAPAYTTEPSAAVLSGDTIQAATNTVADVYVAQTAQDGGGQAGVLFRNVPMSTSPLHVSVDGPTWSLADAAGRTVASLTPTVTGCPALPTGVLDGLCSTLPLGSAVAGSQPADDSLFGS